MIYFLVGIEDRIVRVYRTKGAGWFWQACGVHITYTMSSSSLGSQDGLERTGLLEEASSSDCEKHLQLPGRLSRNDRFTIVDVFQQPVTVLRYKSRGSWQSIIRYIGFSILMFMGVSYYFWSLISSMSSSLLSFAFFTID